MKISVIIASNTRNFDGLLYPLLDDILQCPEAEIIVATPHKPKRLPNRTTLCVDDKETGSTYANNKAIKQATGDYLLFITDDLRLKPNWWDIVKVMQERKVNILSLSNGGIGDVAFPSFPIVERSLLEGPIMRGMLCNPVFRHLYGDNDLGLRLAQHGIRLTADYSCCYTNVENHDSDKELTKKRYAVLDYQVFMQLWKHRIKLEPIYTVSYFLPREQELMVLDTLDNNPFADEYPPLSIPKERHRYLLTEAILITHPAFLQDGQRERMKEWSNEQLIAVANGEAFTTPFGTFKSANATKWVKSLTM